MDRKGLKQAEIRNKLDWSFKSSLHVYDTAKGFCMPKTGSLCGCLPALDVDEIMT